AGFAVGDWIKTASDGSHIELFKSRSGTIGTHTILQNNDVIGDVTWSGSDGSVARAAAFIDVKVDATPQVGTVPGRMLFAPTPPGTSPDVPRTPAERMRIDRNGNVLINTGAISTSAADGFLYIETCAGAPSGTPTSYTGRAPMIYDTTNNKIWFYN